MIDRVDVECRAADPTRAEIAVRVTWGDKPSAGQLAGTVRGPFSPQSHTLPAEFVLKGIDSNLLQGVIVDPCYSSETVEMGYEVSVRLMDSGVLLAEATTLFRLLAPAR